MANREGGRKKVTERILIDHISLEKDWSSGVDWGPDAHRIADMRRFLALIVIQDARF